MGTYSVVLSGQKVRTNIYLIKFPEQWNTLDARLVDTKTNSILSLGQLGANCALLVTRSIMSLFPYNQIILTRQAAANLFYTKHLQPIGGAALQAPFGNKFIF